MYARLRSQSRTTTAVQLAWILGLACLVGSSASVAVAEVSDDERETSSERSAYAAEREATQRGIERYESEWEYDPEYLFPLTRNMSDSGLPTYGQVLLYPVGLAIDLVQWPLGALAGLAGK